MAGRVHISVASIISFTSVETALDRSVHCIGYSMADTVLDDALADFDIPADRLQAASLTSAPAESSAGVSQSQAQAAASFSAHPVPNGASSAVRDRTPASTPSSPLPEPKKSTKGGGKSVGFDPLGKGNARMKARMRNPAISPKPEPSSGASSSSSAQPPSKQTSSQATSKDSAKGKDVDKELAQGMAQLMADLAKVWKLGTPVTAAGRKLHMHT